MCSWPAASSRTHTCVRSSLSCLVYDSHLPSGENCGFWTLPASLVTNTSSLPLSTSTRRSLWSDPDHTRLFESGAHVSAYLSQSASLSFLISLPSSPDTNTSCRPVRSETNAIHFPLGDQRGFCSRQGVSLTRCGSPRSVAMVKISPCTDMAARLLEGDRWKSSAVLLSVTSSVSFCLTSLFTSMRISLLLPLATSSFQMPKLSSYTMVLPSAEILGKKRLPSPWFVTFTGLPPLSEIFQMLLALFITSGPPNWMPFSLGSSLETK